VTVDAITGPSAAADARQKSSQAMLPDGVAEELRHHLDWPEHVAHGAESA